MIINRKHLINLLGYIGVWFISWALSHGFFTATRSFVMAGLGIILFVVHELLKEDKKDRNYIVLIWTALIYSLAVGMVSWGFQHFLDSPARSVWIIPVGFLVSLIMYPFKDSMNEKINWKKSIAIWLVSSLILYVVFYSAMKLLPKESFGSDHDEEESVHIEDTHEK